MIDGILHPLNLVVGLLVAISGVASLVANLKKANKKDVVAFGNAVQQELEMLKVQNLDQQRQLDDKQKFIESLQKQNDLEDQIIEEQYPNLEETLALLAHGQNTILEWINKQGGESQ